MDLTDRQKALLKAIIEEYIELAEPVGSEVIERKYNLGVSPATIRNEMVHLTKEGYLKQPHTSAGRVPTSMGFRLFIQELMKEKQLPVAAEVSIKEKMWEQRLQQERLLKEAVKALAQRCDMLGLALDDEGQIFYAGAANILDWPEFYVIDVTRFVLSLFDENPRLQEMCGLMCKEQGVRFAPVPREYAGDNGAMIAASGLCSFLSGKHTAGPPDQNLRVDRTPITW